MIVCKTKEDVRAIIQPWLREGISLGAVPTMGALHEGHLSLLGVAQQQCQRTVASLYVNPLQFAPHEDFGTYPRTVEADAAILERRGCDVLFAPEPSTFFATDFSTRVLVEDVTQAYCGKARPHFFEGVATTVTKLLMILSPSVAVFGEKDYQQLVTIKRLVRDMDIPVTIIGAPTVREKDGLALSSRNQYLTGTERACAPKLFEILHIASDKIAKGGDTPAQVNAWAKAQLLSAGFTKVDYCELADADNLKPLDKADRPGRLLAAAWLGKTRLIDNIAVKAV